MDKAAYLRIRKDLNLKTDSTSLIRHVFFDFVLFGALATWTWFFSGSIWSVLAAPAVTVLMFRSFAMMHEAVHGVASEKKTNDFIGIFYGGISLLSFEPWKRAHLEHHYWSGNPVKDPVMVMLIVFPKLSQHIQKGLSLSWKFWLPILAVLQYSVFWMISFKKLFSDAFSWKMIMSTLWPPLLWGAMMLWLSSSTLYLVVLPGVLMYLSFTEFVNLPHHLRLPQQSGSARLPIWDQYQSARSCIYPRWLENYVTLNFNYHSEHHMFPDVAWYHLRKLHGILQNELGDGLNTDKQFAWTFQHRQKDLTYVLAHLKAEDLSEENRPIDGISG